MIFLLWFQLEGLAVATLCGFESRLPHHTELTMIDSGLLALGSWRDSARVTRFARDLLCQSESQGSLFPENPDYRCSQPAIPSSPRFELTSLLKKPVHGRTVAAEIR